MPNNPDSMNPKHNRNLRRARAEYRNTKFGRTRNDGAPVIRVNGARDRSKYLPHTGRKQLAKRAVKAAA